MLAVTMKQYGGPEVLTLAEVPTPSAGPGEVRVRVRATALNRADLLQRRGLYPPPPGASEILGLEMAGEIESLGPGVSGFAPGERVMALLAGGGYAQYAVVPAGMLMRLPQGLSFEQGAAIPEAFLTAYLNLFWLGSLQAGETVLVHAGASGVGTSAIQLIRLAGAVSLATAGSRPKMAKCLELGARAAWNHHEGSFVDFVRQHTHGEGVNLILDFVGAPYFHANLESLAPDGRLIVVGTLGGSGIENCDLRALMKKRLQVIGTALRSRPLEDKIALTAAFMAFAHDALARGEIAPVIDRVYDWREVQQAHARMEANLNTGKIVLAVTD